MQSASDKRKAEDRDSILREHVLYLLKGGGAHIHFDGLIEQFPITEANRRIGKLPYTPWQVLEHLRIAQWDIVEFTRDPEHISPEFPQGYWPPPGAVANEAQWHETVAGFRKDHASMQQLVSDPSSDLLTPIPHGNGQTILREALLVADHNAYHFGALMTMKKMIDAGES